MNKIVNFSCNSSISKYIVYHAYKSRSSRFGNLNVFVLCFYSSFFHLQKFKKYTCNKNSAFMWGNRVDFPKMYDFDQSNNVLKLPVKTFFFFNL